MELDDTYPCSWRGIFKLMEEQGELLQVLGKLGPFPNVPHPDGGPPLVERLHDELGDVLGAIDYFITTNRLDRGKVFGRAARKFNLFGEWQLTGINPFPEQK